MAAAIEDALGITAVLKVGSSGQLDVFVDGELVASRQRGVLTHPGGVPEPDALVEAIRKRSPGS